MQIQLRTMLLCASLVRRRLPHREEDLCLSSSSNLRHVELVHQHEGCGLKRG